MYVFHDAANGLSAIDTQLARARKLVAPRTEHHSGSIGQKEISNIAVSIEIARAHVMELATAAEVLRLLSRPMDAMPPATVTLEDILSTAATICWTRGYIRPGLARLQVLDECREPLILERLESFRVLWDGQLKQVDPRRADGPSSQPHLARSCLACTTIGWLVMPALEKIVLQAGNRQGPINIVVESALPTGFAIRARCDDWSTIGQLDRARTALLDTLSLPRPSVVISPDMDEDYPIRIDFIW